MQKSVAFAMKNSACLLPESSECTPVLELDEPVTQEDYRYLVLRFDFPATQSIMHKAAPNQLVLGYTRTMMGFLLFLPKPKRIAMIGLGGGSLAKYCLCYLPDTHFTAVEINPKVIELRDRFAIPPDGTHFQVIRADGAEFVRKRSKLLDVLLVDGFHRDGQAKELCSMRFYDDCYAKLRKHGILVVNLLNSDWQRDAYIARIQMSFNDQVVVIDAEEFGNKILFAYKGPDFRMVEANIRERVRMLSALHNVSLHETAQKLTNELRSMLG